MGGRGTPHNLVLSLLLLSLAHYDTLNDGALLGREVRQVRHVVHGGRRASGARARRVLRCCARGATLAPEVYLIMPGGPIARDTTLTSARLLIATSRPTVARLAPTSTYALSYRDACASSPGKPLGSIYTSSSPN